MVQTKGMVHSVTSQPVFLTATDGRQATGVITIETLTLTQRILKAGLLSVALLVVTALTALVPILHFILVPVALLLTLVVAAYVFSGKQILRSGEGTCPGCGETFKIFKRKYQLPFSDVCETCLRRVTISIAVDSAKINARV